MAVDLRPARASDVDALLAMEEAVFRTDKLSRRSFRHLVATSSASVIVAGKSGEMAGYCVVLLRSGSLAARLYSIAVAPAFSGSGIGQALLAAAGDEARSRRRRLLRLEVREDNARALALYERAGFARTGSRAGYYEDGMTAITMSMDLPVDSETAGRATSHPRGEPKPSGRMLQ